MRDFGKFWEVLGMGSEENMKTTRKACNHGGTPIKILKISHQCRKLNACKPQMVSHTHGRIRSSKHPPVFLQDDLILP